MWSRVLEGEGLKDLMAAHFHRIVFVWFRKPPCSNCRLALENFFDQRKSHTDKMCAKSSRLIIFDVRLNRINPACTSCEPHKFKKKQNWTDSRLCGRCRQTRDKSSNIQDCTEKYFCSEKYRNRNGWLMCPNIVCKKGQSDEKGGREKSRKKVNWVCSLTAKCNVKCNMRILRCNNSATTKTNCRVLCQFADLFVTRQGLSIQKPEKIGSFFAAGTECTKRWQQNFFSQTFLWTWHQELLNFVELLIWLVHVTLMRLLCDSKVCCLWESWSFQQNIRVYTLGSSKNDS